VLLYTAGYATSLKRLFNVFKRRVTHKDKAG